MSFQFQIWEGISFNIVILFLTWILVNKKHMLSKLTNDFMQ